MDSRPAGNNSRMRVQVYEASGSNCGEFCSAGHIDLRDLSGWLPVDAVISRGQPYIKWLNMSDISLTEPFFHQSVERVRREHPDRSETITDINALIQLEKTTDSLRPTGFIFHA